MTLSGIKYRKICSLPLKVSVQPYVLESYKLAQVIKTIPSIMRVQIQVRALIVLTFRKYEKLL